jgi:hypothetical protein
MLDSSDRKESRDPFVCAVRPEPPSFDELIRRPDPGDPYSFALQPPGQIRRWVGAKRARILFRICLAVALGFVIAAVVR